MNVLVGAPPEENLIGLDVNLVHQTILDLAVPGAANGPQVGASDVNGSYQNGAIVGELALMVINARLELHRLEDGHKCLGLAVQGDTVDLAIRGVQDADGAKSEAVAREP